jgi:hypothetical protein
MKDLSYAETILCSTIYLHLHIKDLSYAETILCSTMISCLHITDCIITRAFITVSGFGQLLVILIYLCVFILNFFCHNSGIFVYTKA